MHWSQWSYLSLATGCALFCILNIYKIWFLDLNRPRKNDDYLEIQGKASTVLHGTKLVQPPDSDSDNSLSSYNDQETSSTPLWQKRLKEKNNRNIRYSNNGTFFLAALLRVRIYSNDKARWTTDELKQWMHYMFLAGVEHIYVCDHYKYDSEKLDISLAKYIELGLVTYLPWSFDMHPPKTAQIECYQKIVDEYKYKHTWQIAVDMDEYPFSPIDMREGFLVRYLHNVTSSYKDLEKLTEISMSSFLMLGQGDGSKDIVIERINRISRKPETQHVKPIYRPLRVIKAGVNHNVLQGGHRISADNDELTMLHYWGARTQDWGPDTSKTLSITTQMNVMGDKWGPQVKNSLFYFFVWGI